MRSRQIAFVYQQQQWKLFACIWVLPWKGVRVEEFIPASALDCRITSNCDFWHPTEHPINDLKTVQEVFLHSDHVWLCFLFLSATVGNIPTAKRSCQLIKAQMGTTKFGYDYTHAWPYGMHNDEVSSSNYSTIPSSWSLVWNPLF